MFPDASVFVAGVERQPPISTKERLTRAEAMRGHQKRLLRLSSFFFSSSNLTRTLRFEKKKKAKPFFLPSSLHMRPLPLVATTTTRDDSSSSDQSLKAAPSSPPLPHLLRQGENNRGRGDREEANETQQLFSTEKLRAGIQQLLSSAPAPPTSQQHQQKRREATPSRRRATPRRAPPSSSAKRETPAASASTNSSSTSRPPKAQLALFSVSKPAPLPVVSSALRARDGNKGMEDEVRRFIGDERKEARFALFFFLWSNEPHDSHASFRPRDLFLYITGASRGNIGGGGGSSLSAVLPSYRSKRVNLGISSGSAIRNAPNSKRRSSSSFSLRCA